MVATLSLRLHVPRAAIYISSSILAIVILGYEVAEYYQTEGYNALHGCVKHHLKAEAQQKEIQSTINRLKTGTAISTPKDLAYVEGSLLDDYIHDMKTMQRYVVLSRKAMLDTILVGM